MSKPWGGTKIGSWAADAEAELAELQSAAVTAAAANPKTFPSLKESISSKPKNKMMTLSELYGSSSRPVSGPTTTTPTQRYPDEYASASRGFSNYCDGGRRGVFDDVTSSRTDDMDNWGSMKRNVSNDRVSSSSSSSRYRSLGGGTRADDVDNWSFDKKPVVVMVVGEPTRSSHFGSSFVERSKLVLDPRSSNDGVNGGNVRVKVNKTSPFGAARPREEVLAEKGLNWKNFELEIEAKKAVGGGGGGSRPSNSQSNRGDGVGGSRPTSSQSRVKVNPFGDAKPREVLLEEKGLDWRKIDLELEQRRVHRPETEEETALKEEIKILKKDVESELSNNVSQGSGDDQTNLHNLIESKKRDLEILTRELDDKIRFGQKPIDRPRSGAGRPGYGGSRPGSGSGRPSSGSGRPDSGFERPGSGAGRYMGLPERTPSRPGSFDDYRGVEVMDRPRSRGIGGDIWTRPGEDRRGSFQCNRDRGFGSSRDFNRPTSGGRW